MKKIFIKDKLAEIEMPIEDVQLGEFDYIGEYTAKKARSRDDINFKKVGCFFRPNYERGILISSLIKRFEIKSVFEIGFGRGYSSICAAKAMCDMGYEDGVVMTVDPAIDEKFIQGLSQVFPKEWFSKLNLMKGFSENAFEQLGDKTFDLVYIDGDHRADAVLKDWEGVKDRYKKFVLFDDYRLGDDKKDIEVRSVVDRIEGDKELILMDRRIFLDDRGITDDELDYGQVLLKHPDFDVSSYLSDW